MSDIRTADPNLFKSPQRMSAVDMVIEKIKELLLTKQLRPGDKLPNEMELTKSLSASRGSVREAMKILESFGILEIKRGDGTYISTDTSNTAIDHILFQLIMSDADKKKLMEMRELIESGIIKIIINNAEPADIQKMEQSLHKMEEMVAGGENDPNKLTAVDLEFHMAMGQATHNELIMKIYKFVLDLFAPSIVETQSKPGGSALGIKVHRMIFEGIQAKNLEQAEEAITTSIEAWAEMY